MSDDVLQQFAEVQAALADALKPFVGRANNDEETRRRVEEAVHNITTSLAPDLQLRCPKEEEHPPFVVAVDRADPRAITVEFCRACLRSWLGVHETM